MPGKFSAPKVAGEKPAAAWSCSEPIRTTLVSSAMPATTRIARPATTRRRRPERGAGGAISVAVMAFPPGAAGAASAVPVSFPQCRAAFRALCAFRGSLLPRLTGSTICEINFSVSKKMHSAAKAARQGGRRMQREGADILIGLDSGTSVVKAVAFDLAGTRSPRPRCSTPTTPAPTGRRPSRWRGPGPTARRRSAGWARRCRGSRGGRRRWR